jgi:hypothetical protein
MIRALFRALYRWHLRGQIVELELAIATERKRHTEFERAIYCWNWEITRLQQKLERAGGKKTRSLQFGLSGIRKTGEAGRGGAERSNAR